MNSDDPLFRNYMALFLAIISNYSVSQSLMEIGYFGEFRNRNKKINEDDIQIDYTARCDK